MDKISKKIFKVLRREKLSAEELNSVRQNVLSNIKEYPSDQTFAPEFNHGWLFNRLLNANKYLVAVAVCLIIISSSGLISYAAESALPQNILYPIKINVNEKIKSALTITPAAKAKWQVQLVARRLSEAEKLSEIKELRTETIQNLEKNLNSEVENAQNLIEHFKRENTEDLAISTSSSLEATLKAHAEILTSIIEKSIDENAAEKKDDDEKIKEKIELLKSVAETTKDSAEFRSQVESEALAKPESQIDNLAQEKLKEAAYAINEAQFYFEANQSQINPTEFQPAWQKLQEAKQIFAAGEKFMAKENHKEAFVSFQTTIRLIQAAKIVFAASYLQNIEPEKLKETELNPNENKNADNQDKQKPPESEKEKSNSSSESADKKRDDNQKTQESIIEAKNILEEAEKIRTEVEAESTDEKDQSKNEEIKINSEKDEDRSKKNKNQS